MINVPAETSTQVLPHEQVVIIGAGAAGLFSSQLFQQQRQGVEDELQRQLR